MAFTELFDSGEWVKHYTEADFRLRMREVAATAKRWDEIAAALPVEPAVAPVRGWPGNPVHNRTVA